MSWIAVGATVVGAGLNLYGQNKQSKDNAHAQDLNQQAQTAQNDAAWSNYLMTRGIAPTSPVSAGTMPTSSNSRAVNSRLPLWANVNSLPAPRVVAPTGAPRTVVNQINRPPLGGGAVNSFLVAKAAA